MYEQRLEVHNGLSWNDVLCQATVLTRYQKQNSADLIAARKMAKKIMVKLVHAMRRDAEMAHEESYKMGYGDLAVGSNGLHWRMNLLNNMMHPVGDINNSGCRGWSIDFEIGFPVTEDSMG
jgi:hypothetical protein